MSPNEKGAAPRVKPSRPRTPTCRLSRNPPRAGRAGPSTREGETETRGRSYFFFAVDFLVALPPFFAVAFFAAPAFAVTFFMAMCFSFLPVGNLGRRIAPLQLG